METDSSSEDDDEAGGSIKWRWLEETWPRDSRPAILRIPKEVEKMSIQELTLMHDMSLKQLKSENSKFSMLKRDEIPPKVKFEKGKDDGKKRLHEARWLRLPFSDPKEYYDQVKFVIITGMITLSQFSIILLVHFSHNCSQLIKSFL